MKLNFLIIVILYTFLGFSQSEKRYISLEELTSKYEVKKYTLNTKLLYGIDTEVEMFNIIRDKVILLISVLPDLEENKPKWQEVKWQEIENKIIPSEKISLQILDMMYPKKTSDYSLKTKELYNYSLVKKEKNKFFKARINLFEWFYVVDYAPYVNVSQMQNSILNLGQKTIKRIDFENVDKIENSFVHAHLRNVYLSKIEDDKIYQFWTLDGWSIRDGYNEHRGIDRFAYIPEKGIVGGSYDFYFRFAPKYRDKKRINIELTPEQWEENRKQEKIMWAQELFPERQ